MGTVYYRYCVILFTWFTYTKSTKVYDVETFYMDELCSTVLDITTTAQVKIKTTRSSAYDNNMSCLLSLKGNYRFMIEFKDLDMESGDKLILAESTLTKRAKSYTGYSTPSAIYTTSESILHMLFTSDFAVPGLGFYIVITQFTSVPCSSWQYTCSGDKCVNSTVPCGYLNPCDGNDCKMTKAAASVIAAVIIAAIVFAIICTIVGVYLRFRRGAMSIWRARRQPAVGVVTVMNTQHVTQPAQHVHPAQPVQPPQYQPLPPGYSQQPQASYPPAHPVANPTYGQPMQNPPAYGQAMQEPAYGQPMPNPNFEQPSMQTPGPTVENPTYGQPMPNPNIGKPSMQTPGPTVENPTYGQPMSRSDEKMGL